MRTFEVVEYHENQTNRIGLYKDFDVAADAAFTYYDEVWMDDQPHEPVLDFQKVEGFDWYDWRPDPEITYRIMVTEVR